VFITPVSNDEDHVDVFHNGEPLHYHTMEDILSEMLKLNLAQEDSESHSFIEEEGDSAWRVAIQQEMDTVEQSKSWELANLPVDQRIITLKWVFKLKKNESSVVVKHKAQLLARGFIQEEGVDFDDAFNPIAQMESI
jgi:hypothetical protein